MTMDGVAGVEFRWLIALLYSAETAHVGGDLQTQRSGGYQTGTSELAVLLTKLVRIVSRRDRGRESTKQKGIL
jgi:hypothetical protein